MFGLSSTIYINKQSFSAFTVYLDLQTYFSILTHTPIFIIRFYKLKQSTGDMSYLVPNGVDYNG